MKSVNLKTMSNQPERPTVSAATDTKQLPKWLQQGSTAQQRTPEVVQKKQEQNDTPRWLQEKLEKTEQAVKQAATEKALQEKEVEKKQIPKWMQDQGEKSKHDGAGQERQHNQAQQRPVPKWLQDKPSTVGKQPDDQKKMSQVPKWLQSKTSVTQENTVPSSTGK